MLTKPETITADVSRLAYFDGLHKYRKESALYRQISILDRDTGKEIVICRTYYPGTVAYCCLWIHGPGEHGSGAGKAGGYGYHKESAALQEAIGRAGIRLSEPIDGRGDSAMDDALEAIARAVTGKRKFYMVRAHG